MCQAEFYTVLDVLIYLVYLLNKHCESMKVINYSF